MSRTIRIVLGLGACFLLTSAIVNAGPPIERPMMIHGDIQNTLSLLDGSWVSVESGVCTHGGAYTSTGNGFMDPLQGIFWGSGVIVVANGDKLNWYVEGSYDPLTNTTTGTIWFQGGTGRFVDAEAELPVSYSPTVEFGPGVAVFSASYVSTGTIKF